MTSAATAAVVVDTMVVSALINAARRPALAADYSVLIDKRPIVVSFATVSELRYGAIKAEWGELPSSLGAGPRQVRCRAAR